MVSVYDNPFGEESSQHTVVAVFLGITSALVILNFLFNNLLINIRFNCKMKCYTCGLCIYDGCNILQCNFCLNKVCRDRCFTGATVLKWLGKAVLVGYTIYALRQYDQEFVDIETLGFYQRPALGGLDTLLIIYMCQHPIFIVARIPLFILYFVFTCCCDKSQEVNGEYEFKDSILSFEYIDWQNREVDNFQGFAAGPREVEFNRNLSVVRGTIRNRQSGNASMMQSMRQGNPSALVSQAITGLLHMTVSNQHDCAICILELKANEKVTQLACFEHHVFHPECI